MVAISLFWDTNMAAVTSCENTLLVSQNNETAAMLVSQTNPLGVSELFSYANAFFVQIWIDAGHVSENTL